jgi:hypothetical protein
MKRKTGLKGFLCLLLITCAPVLCSRAQTAAGSHSYKTGIGLRAGYTPGISVKTFTGAASAFEGIFHLRAKGFILTGLYEFHKRALDTERLHWFYGFGAHIGSFRKEYYKNNHEMDYTENLITVGIDGILGLEYHFLVIPFTLGIDLKPFVDIITPGIGYWDGALTLRYAF